MTIQGLVLDRSHAAHLRRSRPVRLAGARLRNVYFWQVQAMVAAITVSHYFLEGRVHGRAYEELHWLPVILFVFPITYAALRFGAEGGVMTGLLCTALSVPNVVVYHENRMEWLVETGQLAAAVAVGILVSRVVRQEASQRRKAEELADRLALINRQLTRAQEDERRRIARELHDETAQMLVLLHRQVDEAAHARSAPQAMIEHLDRLRTTAEEALAGIRRFIRDLRPSVLDDLGMVPAIQWLASEMNQRGNVRAHVNVTGEMFRLPSEAELVLFRVVQESLNNIEKHSGAFRCAIDIGFSVGAVSLQVRDNGSGFVVPREISDFVGSGRLGLVGMQERLQLAGGSLTFESEPGRGTCVRALLPRA